jgi:hypothetical protein
MMLAVDHCANRDDLHIPVDEVVDGLVITFINFKLASASLYLRSSRLYSLRLAAPRPTMSRVMVSNEIMAAVVLDVISSCNEV